MALKNDAKFKEKVTCGLENDRMNLADFCRLKNNNFILERKMA